MIWFTSDYHFNDKDIIKLANRPFKNVDHMREVLVKNHNLLVGKDDTVFMLGDFRLGKGLSFSELEKMLNGKIIFIGGNHDHNNGVNTVINKMNIYTFGYECLLIHDPAYAGIFNIAKDRRLIIHGHVHNAWKFKYGMVNVGIDVWNYRPVHMKQIVKAYEKFLKTENI